jgi:hypothetical protein
MMSTFGSVRNESIEIARIRTDLDFDIILFFLLCVTLLCFFCVHLEVLWWNRTLLLEQKMCELGYDARVVFGTSHM